MSTARFLRDSKTVPESGARKMAGLIARNALVVELVAISVEMINERGIGWANREAFRRLIGRISADEYIVDGKVKPPRPLDRSARVRCMVKADAQVPEVAAASLVAKVYRDGIDGGTTSAVSRVWLGQKRRLRYSRPSGCSLRIRLGAPASDVLRSHRPLRRPEAPSAGKGQGPGLRILA